MSFLPHSRPTYSKAIAILMAVLVLALGSCQARQAVALSVGLEYSTVLHKGKAVAGTQTTTSCALDHQAREEVAGSYSEANAILGKLVAAPAQSVFPSEKQPYFKENSAPISGAPPRYILYKRWKKGA